MTTLIIKSDSDKKTNLLIKFAKELGLQTSTQEFKELSPSTMAAGIGRKATYEELMEYLAKDQGNPLSLKMAFKRYDR